MTESRDAIRKRLLTPLTDEEAKSIHIPTKEEIEQALRAVSPVEQHPRLFRRTGIRYMAQ